MIEVSRASQNAIFCFEFAAMMGIFHTVKLGNTMEKPRKHCAEPGKLPIMTANSKQTIDCGKHACRVLKTSVLNMKPWWHKEPTKEGAFVEPLSPEFYTLSHM